MIYFDNSATTCVDAEVADRAVEIMCRQFGNPSSLHGVGSSAYTELGIARNQIAKMIAARTGDIYFTSGGTESNNIAVQGAARACRWGKHIVTTAIEHDSILKACAYLESGGWQVTYAGQTQESIFALANSGNYNLPYWISNIVLGTIVMLVYPSNFMSICLAKDVREVKKSSLATSASGIWLSIYAIFGVVVLGAVAKGYMVSDPEAGILELCSMAGSPLMLGLVCTFILAAALGTLDSTLISLSGLVSNDLITNMVKLKNHEPTIGADGGETLATIDTRVQRDAKKEVRMTRIIVVVLGVIAFCFSLTDLPLLTLLTDMATNGMSLVVPTVAAGLFWKKATPQGAIASMVTAEAVYLGLYASGVRYVWGGFFLGFPAIAVGIVVMIVVSLATQDKYYKAHAAQQGVFEDFFVRGRVSAWIRENMGTKAAK